MALLKQPQAEGAFAEFCAEVPMFAGETPILMRQFFPELSLSEKSLSKWWDLMLAALSEAQVTEVLGVLETDKALDQALLLYFRDEEGFAKRVRLEDWTGEDPELKGVRYTAVRPAQDALSRLSYRCFPSFRPLLKDYQDLLMVWAEEGRTERMAQEFYDLRAMRFLLVERATRGRDFLDFIEIRDATELSGNFDDFVRLKEELKEKPRAERDDPVSGYLDVIDEAFGPQPR